MTVPVVCTVVSVVCSTISVCAARFQSSAEVSVQFIGASPTVDPCFRAWINRQFKKMAENRQVIDEFVTPQRVSLVKNGVSLIKHGVRLVEHAVSVV